MRVGLLAAVAGIAQRVGLAERREIVVDTGRVHADTGIGHDDLDAVLDRAAADGFAQVDWTDLNERCKRDYAAAVRAVVDERSLDAVRVEAAARKAFDALGALDIVVKQGSARPPKSPKA